MKQLRKELTKVVITALLAVKALRRGKDSLDHVEGIRGSAIINFWFFAGSFHHGTIAFIVPKNSDPPTTHDLIGVYGNPYALTVQVAGKTYRLYDQDWGFPTDTSGHFANSKKLRILRDGLRTNEQIYLVGARSLYGTLWQLLYGNNGAHNFILKPRSE